ncbi:MAG: hypothetical protein ABSA79_09000 [Candidatus Bathyarchaeia archaeon]
MIKNKILTVATIFLLFAMTSTLALNQSALAQITFPKGTQVPTYAFINVAPNPIGIGQTVNVNFFVSCPMENSETPKNMTVVMTDPNGQNTTFGPYVGDTTGGTFFNYVPSKVGNYTFQFYYGGQSLTGSGWTGVLEMPSVSKPFHLVVQQNPIVQTTYPITPLPTSWWETPISAENVQQWYNISGDWLGFGSVTFATTGVYNSTSACNPYTESPLSGHVIWTKQWCAGGVAGGQGGGTEEAGSYWSTRQYQPQYAPVIMDGVMYSQLFSVDMGTNMGMGIQAVNLFTGQTLYTINTTNTLRCGMVMRYHNINQYGALGPFLWTNGALPPSDTGGSQVVSTGTQWNMWDAFTGKYIMSIVNGTGLTLTQDDQGDLIGYYVNSSAGVMVVTPLQGAAQTVTNTGPHMTCFNMTRAIGQTGGSWQVGRDTVRDFRTGIMWDAPVPTSIAGVAISPALSLNALTGNSAVLTTGLVHMQGGGDEQAGWNIMCSLNVNDGSLQQLINLTYAGGAKSLLPFTRVARAFGDGLFVISNLVTYDTEAWNVATGTKVWTTTLKTPYGDGTPNVYDNFGVSERFANGVLYFYGLGGDIWAYGSTSGKLLWYTNTTTLIGNPGIETPYDIWPLWVFSCTGFTNDVAYLCVGHEYNPPLFHGAQMLAINATNGQLIWSELGMYIRSTAIAYNIALSLNGYDNQIYAFGKGPSATTVSAPSVGVTTATPITITGTVMDVSPGAQQDAVARNYANGLPCVSDASESRFMETVYQQQPLPYNVTGVPVTISVLDSNNNFRTIGTATSTVYGTYSLTWTPDIPGAFTVIASFAGSNSYYSSSASTAFYASAPPATPTPAVTAQANLATTSDLMLYIVGAAIAIIIAIAIVGVLMLRKRP